MEVVHRVGHREDGGRSSSRPRGGGERTKSTKDGTRDAEQKKRKKSSSRPRQSEYSSGVGVTEMERE